MLTVLEETAFADVSVPQTDLVLFGYVFNQSEQQLTNGLPSGVKIAIVVNELVTPGDEPGDPSLPTILAETDKLLDPGTGSKEFYVLRVSRFAGHTTDHTPADEFALPGDTVHIFVDWDGNEKYEAAEEVLETKLADILVTDAQMEVRFLTLNGPGLSEDLDGDALPDAWERIYLGDVTQGPLNDANEDGVNNFSEWVYGLTPNENNSSKLPFLKMEEDGAMAFYFRQSNDLPPNIAFQVEASEPMSSPFQVLLNVPVQEMGVEGSSRILKATIVDDIEGSVRFLRLKVE